MGMIMQTVPDLVPLVQEIGGIGEINPRTRLIQGTLVEEMWRQSGWSFVYVWGTSTPLTSGWYFPERNAGPTCQQASDWQYQRNRTLGGRSTSGTSSVVASMQGWVRSVALLPIGYPSGYDALTLYVNRRLWELTVQYDAVTYSQKVRDVTKGSIDCSGWVKFANCTIYDELSAGVATELLPANFKKLFDTAAAWQMTGWKKAAGGWLTGDKFDPTTMLPGTIIGMNADATDEIERPQGIDHIVQVAWHPISLQPHITQSSGGQGVNFEPLTDWFAKWKERIGTDDLYAVDPYAKARTAIGAWLSTH